MSSYKKISIHVNQIYIKLYKINIEGQDMERYQILVVLMGNTRITEEPEFKSFKHSVEPSNKI